MIMGSENKNGFAALPLQVKLSAVSLLLMGAAVCSILWEVWNTRQDYSFGFLAPVFVLYVLFDRKEKIFGFFSAPRQAVSDEDGKSGIWSVLFNVFFGLMFACSILVFTAFAGLFYLTQNRGVPAFTMTFAYSFIFFSSAYFASARDSNGIRPALRERLKFTMLFVFPSFIWIVAAPLFQIVESRISLFLLSIVADITYSVMDTLGYIVQLRGNVIEFPNGSVGVADACSGIRSLTACIFAGSFLAAVMFDKTWKKIALVVLSMALAFFFNLCRAMFLSFWAYENGSESISGTMHDAAGYIILGCTVVGLLAISSLLNLNPVPKEFRDEK